MSKPVIIFGAGASHSLKEIRSTHLRNPNFYPPLTNGLFEERFSEIIARHNLLKERLGQIDRAVQNNQSLETYLSFLNKEGTETAKKQLIEIQEYLKNLFEAIHDQYLKKEFLNSSPYYHFLRDLKRFFEKACIVTFNYDLFLDEAITKIFGYEYNTIKSYYDKPYEFYKVHGSINWGYFFSTFGLMDYNQSEIRANFIIGQQANLKALGKQLVPEVILRDVPIENYVMHPALAIPLPDTKEFIVPEHKENIINHLKNTEKLIIIGWSGNDDYFVNEIKANINYDKVKLVVVSPNSANIVVDKLSNLSIKKWGIQPKIFKRTFSDLVNEIGALESIFNS